MKQISFLLAAVLSAACVAEGDAWFPFVISYAGANNASSVAHMLDAPAGKYGFVRVEQRQFDASKHYLWPIPQKERDLTNNSLDQNPNW